MKYSYRSIYLVLVLALAVALSHVGDRSIAHAQDAGATHETEEQDGDADSDSDAGAEPDSASDEAAGPAESEVSPEVAEARRRAGERFRRGVELYGAGDYRAALIEFQRAHEIAPNYRVLFNLGQASFQLHDYAEAKASFEQYLAEGGDEISEERRAEVAAELENLAGLVSSVEVIVNVEGAEIAVDGRVVGTSPLDAPAELSAGRREVVVSLDGYGPVTRVVDLAGGEEATLEVELLSLSEMPTKLSTGFWISLVATSAVAVGAITTGVLALQANADLDEQLATFPNDAESIASSREKVQNLTLATDILLAAAGVGVITTVLIGIFGRSIADPEDEGDPEAVAIHPTADGVRITF